MTCNSNLSRSMTKPTKWHVHPVKIDQPGHSPSLIRVFAVRMKKNWVHSDPLSAQWRHLSDWEDTQADLSLCTSHFVGFVVPWLTWFCIARNCLQRTMISLTNLCLVDSSILINTGWVHLCLVYYDFRNHFIFHSSKQCRPWSNVTCCCVLSGSTLFAKVQFMGC